MQFYRNLLVLVAFAVLGLSAMGCGPGQVSEDSAVSSDADLGNEDDGGGHSGAP